MEIASETTAETVLIPPPHSGKKRNAKTKNEKRKIFATKKKEKKFSESDSRVEVEVEMGGPSILITIGSSVLKLWLVD